MFLSVKVPPGDLLVHAGDHSRTGSVEEVRASADWLRAQPHPHKVVLAGNHDFCLEVPGLGAEIFAGMSYLQDQIAEIHGLRIYGSPWTPEFGRWAFQRARGTESAEVWDRIPEGVDMLVTHGPPAGIGDLTVRDQLAGCEELRRRVREIRPALHLFGHIHEGYGLVRHGETLFVNASSCSVGYIYMQPPHVFDWDGKAFHPVQVWHAGEPLWEFLVARQGAPRPASLHGGATELGHAFWMEEQSGGGIRVSPRRPGETESPEGPRRQGLTFGVRLQDHWYRLLSDNPWKDFAAVPHLGL